MSQPGQEVEQSGKGTLSDIVAKAADDFAKVLPNHIQADLFVRVATSELRRGGDAHDKIRMCARKNPESLLNALLECAALGHVPGKAGGEAYALTPRFGKEPGIVGIEQYQGEIQRMYRAGGVRAIHCDVVREQDFFRLPKLSMGEHVPIHDFDPMATESARGDLAGAYAFAELLDGAWSKVSWLNAEEMAKHRAMANGGAFWDGVWRPMMWKKTAVHGLTIWVPTSREYLTTRIASQAAADEIRAAKPNEYRPILDGEVME